MSISCIQTICIDIRVFACAAAQTCAEQSPLPQSGLAQFKLLLYGILVKHYSNMNIRPLLPQNLTDVYSAITDLLGEEVDFNLEFYTSCHFHYLSASL